MYRKNSYHKFIYAALLLALVLSGLGLTARAAAAEGSMLSIVSVEAGKSVTIKAENFPANKEFRVLMNRIGTLGEDGTHVGVARTDRNGTFTAKFDIPGSLRSQSRVAIRIEATDRSGYYAYNWFNNVTSSSGSASSTSTSPVATSTSSSGLRLSVTSVVEDSSVTIEGAHFPAEASFSVWMMWKNNQNVTHSVQVGTVRSGRDGAIKATVKFPAEVRDRVMLAVMVRSTSGSVTSAATWFLNANSQKGTGSGAPPSSQDQLPYIRVVAVVEGDEVTIKGYNFPAGKRFDVLMDKNGTTAEDGIEVDSIRIGSSGDFTATFDIPNKLEGRDQIAIRVEASDGSGYYAYTWFENETTD